MATLTAFLVLARGRKRGLARIKKRTHAALRSDLAAIKNTALAIALETPDLDLKRFRTPTTGDQRLLTAARACDQAESQIEETLQEARPMAKRLDVIVRNSLRNDGPVLAAWDKASRFGRSKPSKSPEAVPEEEASAVLESVPLEAA